MSFFSFSSGPFLLLSNFQYSYPEVGKIKCTLGFAYNEFAYYEHPATTSNFFSRKRFLIDIIAKKFGYNKDCIFYNKQIFTVRNVVAAR